MLDDPVGALSAHGLAGIWGTLACGLFTSPRLAELNAVGEPRALCTRGSFHQLGAQALGVGVAFAFVFVVSYAVFFAIKHTIGLRVTAEEEDAGLDIVRDRHVRLPGAVHPAVRAGRPGAAGCRRRRRAPAPAGVTATAMTGGGDGMKMIVAYIRHEAFEPIRADLLEAGFPSLSITEVKGSGRQKAITEHYRGSELAVHLRPKLKLECVVESKDVGARQGRDPAARPHGLGRRRQAVRPAGRGGGSHPHRRGRRGRPAGPRGRRGQPSTEIARWGG